MSFFGQIEKDEEFFCLGEFCEVSANGSVLSGSTLEGERENGRSCSPNAFR